MNKYVALLRGIGPGNPAMHNDKLRSVFEDLGFRNVKTAISSGNVLFESDSSNIPLLEEKIENSWPKKLGFKSTTIIRSQSDLKKLIARNPFKGIKDESPNYLIVTFLKDRRPELCTVVNLNESKTPDYMAKAEKKFGKEITTRTFKSVKRILKAMEN